MSIQWIFLLVQHNVAPPHLVFSFKKRVNCIVDSTVSSVYETIQTHVTPPPPFLWSFLWLSVNAQILAAPPSVILNVLLSLPTQIPPRHQIKMTTDYTFVCADRCPQMCHGCLCARTCTCISIKAFGCATLTICWFSQKARLRSVLPHRPCVPQQPGISLLRDSSPVGFGRQNCPAVRSTNNFKLSPRTRQLRYFIQRFQSVPSCVIAGSVGNAASAVLGAIVSDLCLALMTADAKFLLKRLHFVERFTLF